ncbi:MAG: hypothetical protein Q7J64_03915 [Elusimicrobiota bacterium]|nr:hypothetical protein [Elusimicrobiota bacterium]
MSVLRLAAVLFFLAPWARAQRVVLPAAGARMSAAPIPQLAAPPMLTPAALLAPALTPNFRAPAALFVPSPVPATPAQLTLAPISAALTKFSALDLKSAPSAELRGSADELWRAAIGEEVPNAPALSAGALSAVEISLSRAGPPAAREPASSPRVHLLSKPLHETVELGRAARVLHYVLESAMQFVKAALAWQATGSPAAGLAVLAFEIAKMPPMITAQSLADLGLRYWWRKLSTLRRLADTPGVTRIRVLTTGEAEFSGILAVRKENTGLVFLDAAEPLPGELAGVGSPLPVADLAGRSVRMVLAHNGVSDLIFWTPTLAELLSGAPIPASVAAAWRATLDADKKGKTPLQRLLDFKKDKDLRVEAHLSDGEGGETHLGTVAFGRSVKKLVGLSRLDRVGALFGRAPSPRALPLSDTIVERNGEKAVMGAARRAWRRLTGALIVRP